jgi:hypothetical protein
MIFISVQHATWTMSWRGPAWLAARFRVAIGKPAYPSFVSVCEIPDQSFDFFAAPGSFGIRGDAIYCAAHRLGEDQQAAGFNIRAYSSPEKPVVAFV